MAFLDETGVQNLTAQIKTLADATYAPLSHTHPSTDISGLPTAATATPLMDGTAAVGSSTKYAKEDHVHPTDTSRQATLVSGTNIKTVNGNSLLGSGDVTITSIDEKVSQIQTTSENSYYKLLLSENTNNVTETAKARKNPYLTFNPNTTELVVGAIDNGTIIQPNSVTLMDSSYMSTVTATKVQEWNSAWSWIQGNETAALSDNKVAQNNSTAANDFRVLLSNTASDSNTTAAANKSSGLRFMPSTNHLYVGSEGNDAYISVSPRVYVGAYNRYTQDGQTESSTSYGVGIGINNALAYNSCLTVNSLQLQHWDSSRPSGGVPSSTNYVNGFSSLTYEHILFRDYSGKDSLTAESELTSTKLSFISSDTTYTVTPAKINKWDNYTDTKNTAGSTNTSSKIFLIGATSQAANPQTYSHDTAYVGTNGHLYSNSKQVVNLSDSQTISNKTLANSNTIEAGATVNNPAITSSTTSVSQSTWGATTSTYTKAIDDFVCRRWGPVVMLYIRFTTGTTGGTGTTRTFFTPADNYKPVGLYYCQVNATTAPYAQATDASFWFTSAGILSGRAAANTEYRISCMYLVNN